MPPTTKLGPVHVMDPEAPQGLVCTQVASPYGHTLWSPVFALDEDDGDARSPYKLSNYSDTMKHRVFKATTSILRKDGSDYWDVPTGGTPSNVKLGFDEPPAKDEKFMKRFVGVCVSNTMKNPKDNRGASEPPSKRMKRSRDEFRMTVAVAGALAMPYAPVAIPVQRPQAGDFLTFDPTNVIKTGDNEYVPAIVRYNPLNTVADRLAKTGLTSPAFGVCLETPAPEDQHIRVLLRRDLACAGGTTPI